MVEEPWWQEHEAAGHIAFTVSIQRGMKACAQLASSAFLSLFSLGSKPMEY